METYKEKQARLEILFPGLTAIQSALAAEFESDQGFERMMESENEDRRFLKPQPAVSSEDLLKQYPAAAAYLKAESYSDASHVDKFAAGRKAIKRLLAGENHKAVIEDMDREWSEAARRCAWNS
jgi:hypothetical protein